MGKQGPRPRLIAAAAVAAVVVVTAATVLATSRDDGGIRTKPAGQTPSTTPSPTVLTPLEPGPYRRLDGTFSVSASRYRSGRRLQHRSVGPRGRAEQPSDRRARCRDLAPPQDAAFLSSLRRRAPPPRRVRDGPGCFDTPSGWVEQRLTPEGVERVRSRFLSSGLFDSAQPLSDVVSGCGFVHACVRDGDHWLGVQVDVGGPAASQAPPEAVRLFDDLRMLDSTLPATEWADQQIKPYVPARTAVCLQVFVAKDGTAVQVPTDLSILLPLFPARAAELLDGRDAMGRIPSIEEYGGSCFEMTLDEARTLADEFLAPSGGGSHEYWGIVVNINDQFDASQPPATGSRHRAVTREGNFAHISFKQLLPDSVDAELGD